MCGGLSWVKGGDFNRNIRGWRDYYRDRNTSPYSFKYDMKELKGLWEGKAEIIYSISSRFSLGIGVEFLTEELSGEMSWSLSQEETYFHSPDNFGSISIKEESSQDPKYTLQAIPITFTFYYSFPLGKKLILSLVGGGGYYFGRLRSIEGFDYTFDYTDDRNEHGTLTKFVDQYSSSGEYSEKSTSRTIGFHGGGSLELKISKNFSLVVEALGRLVDFSGWRGQRTDIYGWEHTWGFWGVHSDQGSQERTSEGKLWFVEFRSQETGKTYPRLVFSEEKPVSSFYKNIREGKINLHGLSLRIGFKVQI